MKNILTKYLKVFSKRTDNFKLQNGEKEINDFIPRPSSGLFDDLMPFNVETGGYSGASSIIGIYTRGGVWRQLTPKLLRWVEWEEGLYKNAAVSYLKTKRKEFHGILYINH